MFRAAEFAPTGAGADGSRTPPAAPSTRRPAGDLTGDRDQRRHHLRPAQSSCRINAESPGGSRFAAIAAIASSRWLAGIRPRSGLPAGMRVFGEWQRDDHPAMTPSRPSCAWRSPSSSAWRRPGAAASISPCARSRCGTDDSGLRLSRPRARALWPVAVHRHRRRVGVCRPGLDQLVADGVGRASPATTMEAARSTGARGCSRFASFSCRWRSRRSSRHQPGPALRPAMAVIAGMVGAGAPATRSSRLLPQRGGGARARPPASRSCCWASSSTGSRGGRRNRRPGETTWLRLPKRPWA